MKCRFCHKECPNENSLRNHERLCKGNPNRQQSNLTEYFKPGQIVPSISFEYELDGEKHQYYPDFYLPQYNRYIEVKGYERRKDLVKYTTIPNLIILKYKEIKQIQDSKFNIFDILGNVA